MNTHTINSKVNKKVIGIIVWDRVNVIKHATVSSTYYESWDRIDGLIENIFWDAVYDFLYDI